MTLFIVKNEDLVNGRLPVIPEGVKELEFYDCETLEEIAGFSEGIEKIRFIRCRNLKKLPVIPGGVKELDCKDCDTLEEIAGFSEGIEKIEFIRCRNLKKLPVISHGTKELEFYNCDALDEIAGFSEGIEKIKFLRCPNLKKLPVIPRGTKELQFYDCAALEEIAGLPDGLTSLNLSDCRSLVFTQELLSRLEVLEGQGCVVSYPDTFNSSDIADRAKSKLSEMIRSYANEHRDIIFNADGGVQKLLHRFLTEGLGQRSTADNQKTRAKEIALSTLPILKVLESRPDLLPFVDELSEGFLAACVNQPVRGWSEISAWMSIAQQENIVDRLELAKQLLVLDYVVGFVREKNLVGEYVETEAGNALYREVHKVLQDDGSLKEPWLGVPGPIAYEDTVSSAIIAEIISDLVSQIKENVMLLSHEAVTERICEGQHNAAWGKVCLAKEMHEFDEDYKQKLQDLVEESVAKKGINREEADAGDIDPADWHKFKEERQRARFSKVKELTLRELDKAQEQFENLTGKKRLLGQVTANVEEEEMPFPEVTQPGSASNFVNRLINIVDGEGR